LLFVIVNWLSFDVYLCINAMSCLSRLHCKVSRSSSEHLSSYKLHSFLIFFWRARVCWSLLCLTGMCHPFCIFERCLDSNPESCRSKQARYQFSHPG
jgi:hypothetical protein